MSLTASALFTITGWKEEAIHELDGGGLRRAHVTKAYTGAMQGTGNVEYLMAYRADGSASFLGYEVASVELEGRSGNFLFAHEGEYRDGMVESTWAIVPGSGSGELKGITGSLKFSAGHQESYEITLAYTLEA